MKKLLIGTICLVLIYALAEAKEGNNSRIQGLEADVTDLQNQIDSMNVDAAAGTGDVMVDLCKLYELTGNTPPLFCRDCGNGSIELLEECDDGNIAGGDDCNAYCLREECGNGIIDLDEECDDGNIHDGDGCSFSCAIEYKTVFLTSIAYTGDLGGLDGADAICNDLAVVAGLPGTYKAWLSDSVNSVSQRFTHAGPYILVDGTPIADSWTDLTDGYLLNSISRDEKNTYSNGQLVWTNTLPNGAKKHNDSRYNCDNWTRNYSYFGGVGATYYNNSYWTDRDSISSCNYSRKFYCFEQ
jgi:cysteine-rich repeat protein